MSNPSIVNHFTMAEGRQVVIEFDRAVTADELDGIVALVKGGSAAPVQQPNQSHSLAVDLALAHSDDAASELGHGIAYLKEQLNGSAAQSPG